MPNPAILFVWLCVIVIVALRPARLGRHQGHLPGRRAAADRRRGDGPGRFDAAFRRPRRTRPSRRASTRSRRRRRQIAEPALGRRHPLPLHVVRRQLPQLRRGRDHPRRDARRRPGRGGRPDRGADPEARRSVSSEAMLTPIIVFIGVLSSVASDAGYLVLIPLGAAAFKSVGRNPLAGMAAAFAGVAAGFGVNFLITPLDGVLTEITNDASALADPERSIDLAANLYFGIASTILVTIVADARLRAHRRARPRQARPGARERRRVARRRRRHPRCRPRRRRRASATPCSRPLAVVVAIGAAHRVPRRAAARPGHRRHHRRLAVHGQPDPDHHDHLLRRRARLRARSGDDHGRATR